MLSLEIEQLQLFMKVKVMLILRSIIVPLQLLPVDIKKQGLSTLLQQQTLIGHLMEAQLKIVILSQRVVLEPLQLNQHIVQLQLQIRQMQQQMSVQV